MPWYGLLCQRFGRYSGQVQGKTGIAPGETTADRKFTLDATRCIGCCGLAPVLTVGGEVFGNLTVDDVDRILARYND